MTSRLDQAEWRLDCFNSRMDALQRGDAEDLGRVYTEIRKAAEKRGLEAQVTESGVRVTIPTPDGPKRYRTKVVTTLAELRDFMGTRADDSCWDGYEQRGTKEKGGDTVPNCVKACFLSNHQSRDSVAPQGERPWPMPTPRSAT